MYYEICNEPVPKYITVVMVCSKFVVSSRILLSFSPTCKFGFI